MARKDSEHQKKSMSMLFRGKSDFQTAEHRTEICKPFTKKYTDPSAPYDGYIEDDDTENGARNTLLGKVAVR